MANLLLYRSDGASFIEHRIASDWTIISNKPTNFPPTAHNHDASNITSGTFPQSMISNLTNDLANKTNLNDTIMNTNPFGGRKLYISSVDNAMHAADKKWYVTVTRHLKIYNSESYPKLNPDYVGEYTITGTGTIRTITNTIKPGTIVVYENDTLKYSITHYSYNAGTGTITFTYTPTGTIRVYSGHETPQYLDSPVVATLSASAGFNGNYEDNLSTANELHYIKVRIQTSEDGYRPFLNDLNYPYGRFYLSYYHLATPDKAEYRTYNYSYRQHGVGWKQGLFTDFVGTKDSSSYIQQYYDSGNFGRTIIEFIIHGNAVARDSYNGAWLTQIDWKLDRPNLSTSGSTVTKYGQNKLYYALKFGTASNDNVIIDPSGSITVGGQILVKTNDSRLSDSRPASDVQSWAKAATKPSYNQDEVVDGTTYKRVSQTEKDTWNAKSTLVLGETSVTAYRGDRGKIAYDHSQVAHAPTNAITGITKAMVEAVLTDNITTHYHSAYLSSVPEHTDDVGSYGKATTALYGHVVIKNDLNTSEYLPGEALSAHQGYQLGLNKVEKNQSITAGTKCKITYDAKGLVTGGADLADTDIPNISATKITTGTLPIARGGTGVTSLDSLKAALALTTNSVTSSRPLALADAQDMIIANHATNEILLTVPLNSSVAFPIGTEITIIRYGAGEVKISATTGVTINSVVSNNNKFINAQYQAATLKKMGTDTWLLFGAIR